MPVDLPFQLIRGSVVVIQKAIQMGFSVGIQQRGESRYVHVDSKIRKSGKPNLWSYA